MSDGTRIVRLRPGIDREKLANDTTRVGGPLDVTGLVLGDPERLFNVYQEEMHPIVAARGPGVAVFALSKRRGLEGHLWLEAPEQGARSGSVGRHSAADLCLPDDEALALRHLAIVVRRVKGTSLVRVIDLRTREGLRDERQQPLHAVESAGLLILSVASYWLVVVPTGMPPPWDPKADSPWSTLPERKLTELEQGPPPEYVKLAGGRRKSYREISWATPLRAAMDTTFEALIVENEPPAGHLIVRAPSEKPVRIPVGAVALRRGILLGRYSRCDQRELFSDNRISRVHALILELDGTPWIFDVGSTNGTSLDGETDLRAQELVHRGQVYLANTVTLGWELPS